MLHHNITSGSSNSPAVTSVPGKIVAIDALAPGVRRLVIALQADFLYRAGQHVSLVLPCGARRSLSPARPPQANRTIEFHVARRPGGVLTALLFEGSPIGKAVTIEGPFGDSVFGRPAPALMLATGTGIAPLLAMLEENFATQTPRELTLFWGGRTTADLYAGPALESLARAHAQFRYVPVLSPTGRYVQHEAAQQFPNLSGIDIFACGSPRMVADARATLLTLPGASPRRFHADAFEPALGAPGQSDLTVPVRLSGVPIRVSAGASLLAGLRAAGVPINSVCAGQASCGTCRVRITGEGEEPLKPPDRTERRLLGCLQAPDPAHRLACQITLHPSHAGLAFALEP